jgi:hypothetical protein
LPLKYGTKKMIMKNMLIAATAVGAACAGLIMYLRKNPHSLLKKVDTASPKAELQYRSQHAMG